jgi:hypothetical protein
MWAKQAAEKRRQPSFNGVGHITKVEATVTTKIKMTSMNAGREGLRAMSKLNIVVLYRALGQKMDLPMRKGGHIMLIFRHHRCCYQRGAGKLFPSMLLCCDEYYN